VGFSHGTPKLILVVYFILLKFNKMRFGVSVTSQVVVGDQGNFLSFQICFIGIIVEYPQKGIFDFVVILGEVSLVCHN
jgi:hypothetical protein